MTLTAKFVIIWLQPTQKSTEIQARIQNEAGKHTWYWVGKAVGISGDESVLDMSSTDAMCTWKSTCYKLYSKDNGHWHSNNCLQKAETINPFFKTVIFQYHWLKWIITVWHSIISLTTTYTEIKRTILIINDVTRKRNANCRYYF